MLIMKVWMIIFVVISIKMDIKPVNGQLSLLRLQRPPFNLPSISNPISNPISGNNVLPVQQPQPQVDTSRLMSQMINFGRFLSSVAEAPVNNGTSDSADETDAKARMMAKLKEIYKPVVDKGLQKAADFDKGLYSLLKRYLGDIFDDAAEGADRTVDELIASN